jgi:predicted dienelactone hydrolase
MAKRKYALNKCPGRYLIFLAVLIGWLGIDSAMATDNLSAYDPLHLEKTARVEIFSNSFTDPAREVEIPIRIFVPAANSARPVVIFSHGLGGSRDNNSYLGNHWAARGYVAVFLQHPGSDESVWKGKGPNNFMGAMQQAASVTNLKSRVEDVKALLNQLEIWNSAENSPVRGILDLSRIGISGHSFGARTAQAVSGQRFPMIDDGWNDSRIKAAVMFSPSAPKRGDPKRAFGQVQIPWMLMTGTKDVGKIGGSEVEDRLKVFPALPENGKYELYLFDAEHSAFAERTGIKLSQQQNPNHHRVILALTTAFWDAWLRDDSQARSWLDGDGPSSLLEEKDRWQRK